MLILYIWVHMKSGEQHKQGGLLSDWHIACSHNRCCNSVSPRQRLASLPRVSTVSSFQYPSSFLLLPFSSLSSFNVLLSFLLAGSPFSGRTSFPVPMVLCPLAHLVLPLCALAAVSMERHMWHMVNLVGEKVNVPNQMPTIGVFSNLYAKMTPVEVNNLAGSSHTWVNLLLIFIIWKVTGTNIHMSINNMGSKSNTLPSCNLQLLNNSLCWSHSATAVVC